MHEVNAFGDVALEVRDGLLDQLLFVCIRLAKNAVGLDSTIRLSFTLARYSHPRRLTNAKLNRDREEVHAGLLSNGFAASHAG